MEFYEFHASRYAHPIAAEDFRDLFGRVATAYEFGANVAEAIDALETLDVLKGDWLQVGHFGRKLDRLRRVYGFKVVDEIGS